MKRLLLIHSGILSLLCRWEEVIIRRSERLKQLNDIHDQLDLSFGFGHDDDHHHGQSEYCKWNILAISRPEKDNGDCREPISTGANL